MTALAVLVLCAITSLLAVAQAAAPATPTTIPAIFLSDIHLDPFHDPAKAVRLNAAPASEWADILAAPDAPTQPQDYAALQRTCAGRGTDTPDLLWQSSLSAIRARASHVRFATVSGDLLVHQFDCRYKTLLPAESHASFVSFVEKAVRYIVSSLRDALPGVPIYFAMGNDDSGCTDYALEPTHDEFLGLTARIIAEAFPTDLIPADRETAIRDFSIGGYYSVPLAAVPHTRLIVLDDVFLSTSYTTCSGGTDPTPATAQLAWLLIQLNVARQRHEHVWVLGHIPPGTNFYATVRRLATSCVSGKPQMFLGSERLAEILAENADIVRLAIFGHTHSDEMHLLTTETAAGDAPHPASGIRNTDRVNSAGVPLKIIASITPVNGNRPTFTLAAVDAATATLVDFTVIMASNLTGVDTSWSPEYTYSAAYGKPAFDAGAVSSLIAGFHADPAAGSAASQAYLRNYFPGDISGVIRLAWPQYTCSMDHDSGQSFTACACAAVK